MGYVWLRVTGRTRPARALVYNWQEHEDRCSCMCMLRFTEPQFNDQRGRRFLTHNALLEALDSWEGSPKAT
jgi:hypothetical protein